MRHSEVPAFHDLAMLLSREAWGKRVIRGAVWDPGGYMWPWLRTSHEVLRLLGGIDMEFLVEMMAVRAIAWDALRLQCGMRFIAQMMTGKTITLDSEDSAMDDEGDDPGDSEVPTR